VFRGDTAWLEAGFRHDCWKHEEDLVIRFQDVRAVKSAFGYSHNWWDWDRQVTLDEILPHQDGCSHEIALPSWGHDGRVPGSDRHMDPGTMPRQGHSEDQTGSRPVAAGERKRPSRVKGNARRWADVPRPYCMAQAAPLPNAACRQCLTVQCMRLRVAPGR